MYKINSVNIALLLICNASLLLSFIPSTAGDGLTPAMKELLERSYGDDQNWQGSWFPFEPDSGEPQKYSVAKDKPPPPKEQACDDGVNGIAIDFDPADKRHSYNYLCLAGTSNWIHFMPNMSVEALLTDQSSTTSEANAVTACLNETLSYTSMPPTHGAHRPLAAKYGRYQYLPPQRWLRNLAEGAIVMLYHPCAAPGQVTALENKLIGCVYRHIVTPSQDLQPERPLALVAWGKLLQMSVVDEKIVVEFIKQNAKHGPRPFERSTADGFYASGLIRESKLVTDEEDSEICGFSEM